ncbi:dihydroorotase family protein [Arthrobacter sp. STN4]|uniref:dihydroorotase n=1 Tax=Arthrobacter sp. STN4 TaxID=2923276 RepID=UPI00211A9A48|nr:amidohydrolase family protein [Arthrobacter sp. STN4]MCQ9165473.1 amidohydrolase family protein [Arthrobacter sp. STN4]
MAHDLIFKNGVVVTPSGLVQGGVSIDGESITHVGSDDELGQGFREVNLDGRILFPGVMDPHTHFGCGDRWDEDTLVTDFTINSKDALIGGVTTVATTTLVGSDSLTGLYNQTKRAGTGRSYCDFVIDSVVTDRAGIDEIPSLIAQGASGFKFFTGYIGEQAEAFGMNPNGFPPALFFEACEAIRKGGRAGFAKIHAEEPTVRGLLVDRMRRSDAPATLMSWADTTPEWAESAQVYTYGMIASQLSVPFYPVHISTARTLDTIRWMRSQGTKMTIETLTLFLNATAQEMDARKLGGMAKIQPPLRHQADQDGLWDAVVDGTIQTIGTDTCTYSATYKTGADFWGCRVGVNIQFADTIALMMTNGVATGRIDLRTMARLLSENPAKRYGIYPQKGAITVGADADLVVIDPEREMTLGVDRLRGKSDYSVWEGTPAQGVPVLTTLRGNIVMEDGEITADEPKGMFLGAR